MQRSSDDRPFSIVCLSSQEWRTPLPTNRQQIMHRAALRGHHVLFVETGDWVVRHLWKVVRGPDRRSLARRLTIGEDVAQGVRVVKLIALVPLAQRSRLANELNWRLGAFNVRRAARLLPTPSVVWIYEPRAVAAAGALGEDIVVYDCVDDYAEQAATDHRSRRTVAAADEAAARRARVVFATTRPLLERHRKLNPNTHLVRNVGDFDHFRPAAERETAEAELLALPRPVLGFMGSLDPSKVDFAVLRALAAAFATGTLLVAGPARGGGVRAMEELCSQPNVNWLGLRAYARLPQVLAAFDVALIPYLHNDYTRSCFPLKLFEYLAAGKAVVATGLPELQGMEPHVVVADDARAAVDAVRAALDQNEHARDERIALASANTWDSRTERLLSLVDDELERSIRE